MPSGIQAKKLVKTKSQELVDGGVHIYMGAEVETIGGVVGNFQAHMSNGMEIKVGAVVIATGCAPYQPKEFGYRPKQQSVPVAEGGKNIEDILESKTKPQDPAYPEVINNMELEQMLRNNPPTADRITFVACVGSRCGDMGCSRYCCTSMIGQALRLRQMGKVVRVLYKEIRTYSRQSEELYERAMRAGVQFFQYDQNKTPQECISIKDGVVTFYDHLLGVNIDIPTGLLVLVLGLRPTDDQLAEQLKLARSEDGFYMELHPKLGPVETAVQGVFLAGAAQGAKDVRELMAQALAAAGKTGALLIARRDRKRTAHRKIDPGSLHRLYALC